LICAPPAVFFKAQDKYSHIRINGIHIHIGITDHRRAHRFVGAIKKVVKFIDDLKAEGIHIEYLDIGGGLGIIYNDEKTSNRGRICSQGCSDLSQDRP